ncbi:IclR family transcriptional regulator domain-containing protein [Marivirga sp.]|uniref:IclR family transcriptional regulator domain-containing protein n=1 Tax=Marivirga sp. TaxID=2018662 RepID=UPI002D7FC0F4|nr:IclR family transcriptional regulator C-terminal domain-containing protein [Marivirga sp.]HET8861356.1 IclR family transcriptional regulator C-terminal domain-containing protein [Marivirga sp.]
MEPTIKKSDFVQSLEKGLKVIAAFDAENDKMTLTEVSKKVDLTRANARRILLTLQYLGFVQTEDGKQFSLSPKVLTLGYSYLSALPFQELAKPYLRTLADEVNESCSMSVLDGYDIVYVARVQTNRIMTISLGVGTRLPVYATSMGRVLLAGLPDGEMKEFLRGVKAEQLTPNTITDSEKLIERVQLVKERGWALADQELEIGVRSIACPIKDKYGKTISALNISGHASRVSKDEMLEKFLPHLKSTVAQIENAIHKSV